MAALPCDNRFQTCNTIGAPFPAAPGCSAPALRAACQPGPWVHLHVPGGAAHSICNSCRNRARAHQTPVEHAQLDVPRFTRGVGAGAPKYITNIAGVLGLLCKFCEADEQELHKRHTALGHPAPLRPRYCCGCRGRATLEIVVQAANNSGELLLLARDQAGTRQTAHPMLTTARQNRGRPAACRCGRDTIEATLNPKVTQCLCCGGVQVDVGQVKVLRHTQANIVAANAAGTLPALSFVAAAFDLNARGPVVGNAGRTNGGQVGWNNNRK
ncbi:hypothetical protein LTR36_001694 [Oleoguttula mirabilis]|uniref:Uncharacterized protein n=1 Tax=Oleoguttula mirabilis TaxID=1507867 RepID=A0AAV9JN43_9PEZI|nr:hypothetical protein LTR36_001694 [Oleoguttula mirabilis]